MDQEVLVVSFDPHHLGLRVAGGQQRCDRREVLSVGQLEDGRMKLMAIRLVGNALVSSLRC
jgi:hypothetical protein